MFESYQVGAIFTVRNMAAATLTQMAQQIGRIDELARQAQRNLTAMAEVRFGPLSQSARTVERSISGIAAASESMRSAVTGSLEAVNAGLMMAARTARELSVAIREVSVGSRAMAAAGGIAGGALGGRGGGGGGGRGGGHISGYVPLGGPVHARFGVNAGVGAALALGYGVYEEAQLRDAAARLMLTAQIPTGPGMDQQAEFKTIRETLLKAYTKTGLPIHDIEQASLTAIRQMGGFPFQKRMDVLPDIIEFAATEARLKDVSVEEATQSLVGLIHMTGTYEPDKMRGLASRLAFASTISPLNLEQIERAASYAIPTLRTGLNMDPAQLLLLMSTMQSSGVLAGKSGTWPREFFTRLFPNTSLISGLSANKQIMGLRQLGLMGPDQKPTFMDHGQVDLMKLAETLHSNLQKVPETRRLALLRQTFGAQGAAFATIFQDPAFLARFPELQQQMQTFRAGPEFLQQYAGASPVQQGRQLFADFTKVMMELAKDILPTLIEILKSIDATLKFISGFAGQKGMGALVGAASGAAAGYKFGGLPGAVIGVTIGGGIPLMKWVGESIGSLPTITDPVSGITIPFSAPDSSPGRDPNIHRESFVTGGKGGPAVTIGTLVIQSGSGDPKAHAETFLQEVNRIITRSQTHNLGDGISTSMSPFTAGRNA